MSKTTRLPVQHKDKPHCPTCEAPIPNFDNVAMMLMPECDLVAVIFQVRCSCGSIWNLQKTVKS